MKNKKLWIAVAVIALAVIAYLLLSGGKKKETVSFQTARVERSKIQNSITATGTIEPVTSVTVGTQVSGIVAKLYVDYNSVVKKGQVIAELDRTNLISELNAQKASLSTAQSQLNYQEANYNRYKTLYDKGLVSADEFENARLTWQQAKNQVATARESVQRAQTNLGYATITSPIDGVVLNKAVEEGQTVAASFNTPELFTIAKDLTDMRVIAKIDEADIGGVKEGQRVSFSVDAFPDDQFEGHVTQVRQQATTESNVVTYEVVISAPNYDLKLKPGLTANVTIYTLEKNDGNNHLHGVYCRQVFEGAAEGDTLIFRRVSPDGEEGYPGTLTFEVRYSLTERNALEIEYRARTDADTVVNFTNHTYFNLNGCGDILGHTLTLCADRYTEGDAETLPTGRIAKVTGTPMDFRAGRVIGEDIGSDFEQLRLAHGYDHNFVLNGDAGSLRKMAAARGDRSGIRMEAFTTQPGVQLYTGNFVDRDPVPFGKGGVRYPRFGGFCLESQHFPCSPNFPDFPTTVLRPGEEYRETTVYRFFSE